MPERITIPQQLAQLGGILQMSAQADMQARAMANNWNNCMFGSCPLFGMDPAVAQTVGNYNRWAAQENYNMDLARHLSNIPPAGNYSQSSSTFGGEQLRSENPADCFQKLNNETLKKLQDLEKEIKAEQEKFEQAKEAKNNDEKSAVAKRLNKLRDEYRKLERTVSSSSVSKKYGKEFNFYTNLSENELETIKYNNSDISQMKKDLQKLESELQQYHMEVQQKMQQLQATGRNPNEVPQELKDKVFAKEQEIKDLKEELSKKITELENYIKKAGESTDDVDWDVAQVEAESEKTQAAKEKEKKENEKIVTSLDDAVKAIQDKNKYDSNTVAAIETFLKEQKGEKSDEEFKADMQSTEFFKNVTSKFKGINATDKSLAILESIYDKLLGQGSFKTNWAASASNSLTGTENLIKALAQTAANDTESMKKTLSLATADKAPDMAKNLAQQTLATVNGILNSDKYKNPTDEQKNVLNQLKTNLKEFETGLKAIPACKGEYENAINKIDSILNNKNAADSVEVKNKSDHAKPEAAPTGIVKVRNDFKTNYEQIDKATIIACHNQLVEYAKAEKASSYIESLDDEILIAILNNADRLQEISDALFDGWDDEQGITALLRRLQKIADKLDTDKAFYIIKNCGHYLIVQESGTDRVDEDTPCGKLYDSVTRTLGSAATNELFQNPIRDIMKEIKKTAKIQ